MRPTFFNYSRVYSILIPWASLVTLCCDSLKALRSPAWLFDCDIFTTKRTPKPYAFENHCKQVFLSS